MDFDMLVAGATFDAHGKNWVYPKTIRPVESGSFVLAVETTGQEPITTDDLPADVKLVFKENTK
jgi:hypothetical protein